jgi:hypothetical protein
MVRRSGIRRHPCTVRVPWAFRAFMTVLDRSDSGEPIPLGQRLFDNVFLLLIAGVVIVFVLYTGWGLWEITSLPTAELP